MLHAAFLLIVTLKIWEGPGTRLSLPILMQCLLYISRGTNFLACHYSWNSQSNAMTYGHLTVINCSCSLKSMYSTCTCLPCGKMFLYVEVYSRKPHAYVVRHCNIVDYAWYVVARSSTNLAKEVSHNSTFVSESLSGCNRDVQKLMCICKQCVEFLQGGIPGAAALIPCIPLAWHVFEYPLSLCTSYLSHHSWPHWVFSVVLGMWSLTIVCPWAHGCSQDQVIASEWWLVPIALCILKEV